MIVAIDPDVFPIPFAWPVMVPEFCKEAIVRLFDSATESTPVEVMVPLLMKLSIVDPMPVFRTPYREPVIVPELFSVEIVTLLLMYIPMPALMVPTLFKADTEVIALPPVGLKAIPYW